jgi:hypothetical protein
MPVFALEDLLGGFDEAAFHRSICLAVLGSGALSFIVRLLLHVILLILSMKQRHRLQML